MKRNLHVIWGIYKSWLVSLDRYINIGKGKVKWGNGVYYEPGIIFVSI